MARRARIRGSDQGDYWPGFIDALSTLLLVITFLLAVFMLAQHFLSRTLADRDATISQLQTDIAALAEQLALEQADNADLRTQLGALTASLAALEARAERAEADLAVLGAALDAAQSERDEAVGAAAQANDQLALLNQQIAALRAQLASLQEALEAAEAKDVESQAIIADLGKRLNAALASKVQELARYRSEFFGRLREILGERADIRIEGDRFVFQSELLFETGSAVISETGAGEIEKLAGALSEIAAKIPGDIDWVVRVDGHSDTRPIATPEFPTNWHLSAARAIAVVRMLIDLGVPSERLVAAGFGEFRPLDTANTPEAFARNRRIEFKLTER